MQSCAVALGQYAIRANAILPGTIATDINKDDLSDLAKREGMIKRTALGRLGGKYMHCLAALVLARTDGHAQLPMTSLAPWCFLPATWPSM